MPYSMISTTAFGPPAIESTTQSQSSTMEVTRQGIFYPPEPPEGEEQTNSPTFFDIINTSSVSIEGTTTIQSVSGYSTQNFTSQIGRSTSILTTEQGLTQTTTTQSEQVPFTSFRSSNRSRTVPGTSTNSTGGTFTIPFSEREASDGTIQASTTTTFDPGTVIRENTSLYTGVEFNPFDEFLDPFTKYTTESFVPFGQTDPSTFIVITETTSNILTFDDGETRTVTGISGVRGVTSITDEFNTFDGKTVSVDFPQIRESLAILEFNKDEVPEPDFFSFDGGEVSVQSAESWVRSFPTIVLEGEAKEGVVNQTASISAIGEEKEINSLFGFGRETLTTTTQRISNNQYTTRSTTFLGNFTDTQTLMFPTQIAGSKLLHPDLTVSQVHQLTRRIIFNVPDTLGLFFNGSSFSTFARKSFTTETYGLMTRIENIVEPGTGSPLGTEWTSERGVSFTATSEINSAPWGYTTTVGGQTAFVSGFGFNAVTRKPDMVPPFGRGFEQINQDWIEAARAIRYSTVYNEVLTQRVGGVIQTFSQNVIAPISGGTRRIGLSFDTELSSFVFTGTEWRASFITNTDDTDYENGVVRFSKIYTFVEDGSTVSTTETSKHVFSTHLLNEGLIMKSAEYGHAYNKVTRTLHGAFHIFKSTVTNGDTTSYKSIYDEPEIITVDENVVMIAQPKTYLTPTSFNLASSYFIVTGDQYQLQ